MDKPVLADDILDAAPPEASLDDQRSDLKVKEKDAESS
jgi:hypothetical protein